MTDDLLRLRRDCVDFALRLHPNQTKYERPPYREYPSSDATVIISPSIEIVLATAAKIFAWIAPLGEQHGIEIERVPRRQIKTRSRKQMRQPKR